ncbi:hypothetical protein [Clostridium magnum]|uniref:Uncharacterized protein n=1 Tax=Clostridium magnum DSM 2767 TaxID=1121326 RepID=A0A162UXL1_9CLOT|nr:hypothetical protein [Clostridium magnum]KZL94390.1 hypothetical protein CLMAG_14430 [Clostridium magnum DSM 2767]SHJ59246.1 hypothetical protein SAMN02745944_06200 [Clostridium magnum DSM 2767]
MFSIIPEKTYSFSEGLKILGMSRKERAMNALSKVLNDDGVQLKEDSKLYNTLVVTLGIMLYAEKVMAKPTTGMPSLDDPCWKIVGVFQSVIFYAAMFYTFKALLELIIKGEGSWKKVGTGFLVCAADYLIPWFFEIIRGAFI